MAEQAKFPSIFEESAVDAEFKQKINVEFLTLKQIDRVNTASYEGDEGKFNNAVESLLAMLPKENRARLENEKSVPEYTDKIEQPVYQYSCGKPMGSLDAPIYRNLPTDWNYKGGEPVLVSPIIEEVDVINYQKLFKMILAELQDVGVTWKIEPRGNIEKRIDPPATPLVKLRDGKLVRLLIDKGLEGVKDYAVIETPVEKTKIEVGEKVVETIPFEEKYGMTEEEILEGEKAEKEDETENESENENTEDENESEEFYGQMEPIEQEKEDEEEIKEEKIIEIVEQVKKESKTKNVNLNENESLIPNEVSDVEPKKNKKSKSKKKKV